MPHTPARKSLAVSRNGLLKAHQPFRDNDLERGKKTGKTVTKVSRDSDDFEPFEEVLVQAYTGDDVPRPVNKRRRQTRNTTPEQDEEDYENSGEVSMDIDSGHDSPSAYVQSAPAVSWKPTRASSHPIATSSSVDYDNLPSPRPPRRSSAAPLNKAASSRPKNPSSLRTEIRRESDINEVGRSGRSHAGVSSFSGTNAEESQIENEQPSLSHSNLSFTLLAQDEDNNLPQFFDGDENEEEQPVPPSRKARGKQRAVSLEDDHEEERDILQGFDDANHMLDDDEKDEQVAPIQEKNARKAKGAPESASEPAKKRAKKAGSRSTKRQTRISIYETLDDEGLRRSKRQHYAPLEFWRLEKVVYGKRENGPSVVPVIKEIIRMPKPPIETLGSKRRKKTRARAQSNSKSVASPGPATEEIRIVEVENPEAGWDNDTETNGIIWDYRLQTEVERRIAFPGRLVKAKVNEGEKFAYDKIFGDGNFVAAGQLIIPPGMEKPTKPTKDNTYLFFVIEGAVECKIHRSSFVLSSGGMFMVPRGNQYYIKNICERNVKLFFAQARKVAAEDLDALPKVAPPRSPATPRSKTVDPGTISKPS